MPVVEAVVASLTVLVCALLLLRLAIGPARRARSDAALRRLGRRLQATWDRLVTAPGRRRAAARETRELIDRVRRGEPPHKDDGEWVGNVYRPKAFKRPKKPH